MELQIWVPRPVSYFITLTIIYYFDNSFTLLVAWDRGAGMVAMSCCKDHEFHFLSVCLTLVCLITFFLFYFVVNSYL